MVVALLAEGVDRNLRHGWRWRCSIRVALLAEGVDRNVSLMLSDQAPVGSPSSRRAWIEITTHLVSQFTTEVALLAEGVDRNHPSDGAVVFGVVVALLAEGVDRNVSVADVWIT